VHGRAQEAYANLEHVFKKSGLSYRPEKHAFLARLALFAGDTNRALSELETKSWGSEISLPWLCVDHFWDVLRTNPRFQRLVKGECRASSPAS
jgi:hypothetical protein